jgi:hypothetical protein
LDIWDDSSWLSNGVAFSPNSRFLYVSASKVLLQFDMWASNAPASVDTVGRYDGFQLPFGSYFDKEQLAPDGKIYISCGNTEADYHVISNPNGKGDSCNFEQHALRLPTLSACVPNYPNYRLGALTGSACDTITGLNETARSSLDQILKVFPNPATDITTIDYGFTDWNKGQPALEICNALGQTVYTQYLPMYSVTISVILPHPFRGILPHPLGWLFRSIVPHSFRAILLHPVSGCGFDVANVLVF